MKTIFGVWVTEKAAIIIQIDTETLFNTQTVCIELLNTSGLILKAKG